MTVAQARALIRRAVRNGSDDSQYKSIDVDAALQRVGRRFCRQTQCLPRGDEVAVTQDDTTFPIGGTLTDAGFTTDQILDVTLTADPARPCALKLVAWPELNERAADYTGSGIPRLLAFAGRSGDGVLWPIPDQDYTALLRWWEPFTSWTAGDESAGSTVLNLTDEQLDPILQHGAPSVLLSHSNEKGVQSDRRWQLYLAEEKRLSPTGNLGRREQNRTHWRDRPGIRPYPIPTEGGYNP